MTTCNIRKAGMAGQGREYNFINVNTEAQKGNLLQILQLISSRARVQDQASWYQSPCLLSLYHTASLNVEFLKHGDH